jgi:hypothetical protein
MSPFCQRVLSPTLKSCESGKPKERWNEDLERLTAHSVTAENIVIKKEGITSLDIYGQFSPTSTKSYAYNTWSKKQKRAYHCALSGLKRCQALGYTAFFLTLTSSPKTNHPDLRKDWAFSLNAYVNCSLNSNMLKLKRSKAMV